MKRGWETGTRPSHPCDVTRGARFSRRVDPLLARAKRDPPAHTRPAPGGLRGAGADPVGRWMPDRAARKGSQHMAPQLMTRTETLHCDLARPEQDPGAGVSLEGESKR